MKILHHKMKIANMKMEIENMENCVIRKSHFLTEEMASPTVNSEKTTPNPVVEGGAIPVTNNHERRNKL